MLPINNGETSPCSNISSNCVVWQGPDIPCISLCSGDTVSEVVAKLAEQLCDIVSQTTTAEPDLSGLDLLCVLPSGQTAPDTITDTIQLIIDYVCDLSVGGDYTLPDMNVPSCFDLEDSLGNPITTLPLDQFATMLANKICDILSSIELINSQILDHESRIVILENCVLPCSSSAQEVNVLSSCIFQDQTVAHSVLTLALETRFCDLESAVGVPALITNAINASSCITGSTTVLSGTGTYGSLTNWVNNPSTLSHAVQNAWVVLCDMYAAIQTIQTDCCPGACDSIVYAFTASLNTTGDNIPTGITALFTGSSVPASYNDCSGSSTVTITDGNGASISSVFSIASLQSSSSGLFLALTGLYLYDDFTVSVDFCTTDGVNTCSETLSTTVASEIPCPGSMTQTATTTTIDVSFNNWIGSTAIYVVRATNVSTGSLTASNTITNPGVSVSTTLTGLTAGTTYLVSIEVGIGGRTRTCDFSSSITTGEAAATNYRLQSCNNPGDVLIGSYSSGTLTTAQSVRISHDSGADCWEVIGTSTAPSTTTINTVYTDCIDCSTQCLSYRITSNDVNNDGDVEYTDCSTGLSASTAVVGVTTFTICSTTQPYFTAVSGSATITQLGICN